MGFVGVHEKWWLVRVVVSWLNLLSSLSIWGELLFYGDFISEDDERFRFLFVEGMQEFYFVLRRFIGSNIASVVLASAVSRVVWVIEEVSWCAATSSNHNSSCKWTSFFIMQNWYLGEGHFDDCFRFVLAIRFYEIELTFFWSRIPAGWWVGMYAGNHGLPTVAPANMFFCCCIPSGSRVGMYVENLGFPTVEPEDGCAG